ncbi:hypothetical protein U3516DRAFT_739447 [Neocallimastix sp. 'constans']
MYRNGLVAGTANLFGINSNNYSIEYKVVVCKETPYRSTLRDPQGKAEPAIGSVLAIPEELETVILSDKAYAMGFLKCQKYRKHTCEYFNK